MKSKAIHAGLMAAALVCAAPAAQSAIMWNFEETGGNVVGSFSGTLNLTGLSFCCDVGSSPAMVNATDGSISTQMADPDDFYTGVTGSSFGTGGQVDVSSYSGDALFVSPFGLGVPDGYAGGQLSGSVTFNSANFASLGITPGTYVYSWSGDTLTAQFGPVAAVPEPSAFALMAVGLAGLAAAARRRKAN